MVLNEGHESPQYTCILQISKCLDKSKDSFLNSLSSHHKPQVAKFWRVGRKVRILL